MCFLGGEETITLLTIAVVFITLMVLQAGGGVEDGSALCTMVFM